MRYFAYGSNLDAEQMAARCPSSRGLFRARLRDHRLDFSYYSTHWVGGTADLVSQRGESVWGVVYELLVSELPVLDRFEGGYQRVTLTVEDDAGQDHPVVSYSVLAKGSFRPTQDYLERILRGAAHWKLPPDYLERLRVVAVL